MSARTVLLSLAAGALLAASGGDAGDLGPSVVSLQYPRGAIPQASVLEAYMEIGGASIGRTGHDQISPFF